VRGMRRWLLIALAGAACACGHLRPIPPGSVPCDVSCANARNVCSNVVLADCVVDCNATLANRPQFSSCLSVSMDCSDVNDCDR
jgi:hypothetical protein